MSLSFLPNARRKEFAAIFRAHYPAVLAYFRRRSPGDVSEELCAEVFERAWTGFDNLQGAPLPWLYGIARNVLLESYRCRQRQADSADPAELADAPAPSASFAEHVDLSLDVNRALVALRPAEREILLLSAWEGLSPTEVAEVLDITPANARVRLHRARAALTELLEQS
ncbi:RNA polymerase sigma factor [Corynebacterium lizhenjunii]|uniref:RNA polymerase sigma factor n=1 Tax=Corynebacterium lizhenjunii TaxID=2709394 RepID=A0A7T0KEL5_9CORY|nr:RNA polymerase sigma factor [Corynebacterium lizhenjunii]QPK78699.1 RNA polymerase sigma factor [Corynebacterium lizhenjunii]